MAVEKATGDADAVLAGQHGTSDAAHTREQLIAEALDWCAELFASNHVRFVRPADTGGWVVYTRRNGSLSTHEADFAEVAMAHTVGLGRQPLLVSRPRIMHVSTNELRPISVSSYLGIPLVCQDRLAGVIECAGEARPDIEMALHAALPRLLHIGARLLYDPALLPRPAVNAETVCALCNANWTAGGVTLSVADLSLLACFDGDTAVAAAAALAGIELDAAIAIVTSAIERGLVDVQP